MTTKILLVEDDAFISDGLGEILTKENYAVLKADSVLNAEKHIQNSKFDLFILDVMLPDGNGYDLCRYIRNFNKSVPILFLTACDDEMQIVRGLDAGADDYVTKPFKLLELLSRVRALLRRSSRNTILTSGNITVDCDHMTVKADGEFVFVTPIEYQILAMLIRNNGVILTRKTLLQNIWDDNNNFINDNTLSVHVSRLRDKIGANHIATVRGIGYRWEE